MIWQCCWCYLVQQYARLLSKNWPKLSGTHVGKEYSKILFFHRRTNACTWNRVINGTLNPLQFNLILLPFMFFVCDFSAAINGEVYRFTGWKSIGLDPLFLIYWQQVHYRMPRVMPCYFKIIFFFVRYCFTSYPLLPPSMTSLLFK